MVAIKMGASGRVTARRLDKGGSEIQRLDFSNDVLKSGLNDLTDDCMTGFSRGRFEDQFRYLFLGTGTTEPSPDDTGLEARSGTLAGKQMGIVTRRAGEDTANDLLWTEIELRYAFGAGEAEGVWTELGLAYDASYVSPFTRALFRDESGAAISLTILSDEFLELTYTVRFYSDVTGPELQGSFTIGGVTKDYYLEAAGFDEVYNGTDYYSSIDRSGLWGYFFPFNCIAGTTDPNVANGVNNLTDNWYVRSASGWDSVNKKKTYSFTIGPSTNDIVVRGIYSSSYVDSWQDRSRTDSMYNVFFSGGGFVKKADYQVTFTLEATISWSLGQIENVQVSAATATTLDFTWDAYPNATSYELELRDGSTVVAAQTVNAPTLTASFTGLTASTDYNLDIRAVAPEWGSSRSIVPGSTTA